MKRISLILFVCAIVLLTGCDRTTNTPQEQNTPISVLATMKNVSWLREKLPATTLAYFRIPSLWQLFFEEKADILYPAQKLESHKEQIENFKQGLLDSYMKLLPEEVQPSYETLVMNISTPLEIAVIKSADGSVVPDTLLATTLKNTSNQKLSKLLGTWETLAEGKMQIIEPLNSDGFGKIVVAMMPAFISYNEESGRLLFYSGIATNKEQVTQLLTREKHAPELDDIFAFENSVDTAGKNLELWINIKEIYQQNKNLIPPHMLPVITQMGIDQMQYLWAGTASAQGKSQLIVRLAMPDTGFRKLMPRVNSKTDVAVAGNPRSVWQIGFPDVEQYKQALDLIVSLSGNKPEIRENINDKIKQINEYLGISLADIVENYGQKLVIVTDDSGTWYASKIKDMQKHNELMEKLSEKFKTESAIKELAGVKINESRFATDELTEILFSEEDPKIKSGPLYGLKQYAYYMTDNNYLIQADNPQILADRANDMNKLSLDDWLNQKQKTSFDNSILAYSKEVRDAPRDIYYGYLQALQFLATYTHTELDLFALPTAKQLNLPQTGRFGFAINSSADALSLNLSYEYQAFEKISENGFVVVAAIGVMMAYAIPAYRDYTLRAKVAERMYMTFDEKYMIEDSYYQNGNFPQSEAISEKFSSSDEYVYNPKNGEIMIYFGEDMSPLAGKYVKITPVISEEGLIHWECSGTVEAQYYQSACY